MLEVKNCNNTIEIRDLGAVSQNKPQRSLQKPDDDGFLLFTPGMMGTSQKKYTL